MTIKQYMAVKRIRQLEVAKAIGADNALLNKYLNGWQRLPEKYWAPLCAFLGITTEELTRNKISRDRL